MSNIFLTPFNTSLLLAICSDHQSLYHLHSRGDHGEDNCRGKALKSVQYLFATTDIMIGGKPSKLSTCFSPPFTHLLLSIANAAAQFEKFSKPVKILNWLQICSTIFSMSTKLFESGLLRDEYSSYN